MPQSPLKSADAPSDPAAKRRERYAIAIHDAMEPDLSLVDQEPGAQALFARAAEAAMALADAEQTVPPLAEDVTASVSEKRARLFGFIEVGAEESDFPSFAAAIDDYVNAVTAPIERARENADFHLGQEMARRQLAQKEADRLRAELRRRDADHPNLYAQTGIATPGCDCGHDGMGEAWHMSDCLWRCGQRAAVEAKPFIPPAHYRRDDGVDCCVHTIPVGPDSCPACRDLADDDRPAAGPGAVDEVVAALKAKALALSVEAEEEMRRDLEEQAQVWHEAAEVARRTGRKAASSTPPAVPEPAADGEETA